VKLLRADIAGRRPSHPAWPGITPPGKLVQARELYVELGRRVGAANALRELGAVEAQIGDTEAARSHYTEAFMIYLRTRRRTGAAAVARRLGYLDMLDGTSDPRLLDRADRRLRQSLRLGGDEPTNAAAVALLRARIARLRGHFDDAEALIEESARQYLTLAAPVDGTGEASGLQPGMNRNLSETTLEAGFLARDRNRPEAAIERFTQALALLDESEDPGAASLAHYEFADELIQADQVDDAPEHAVRSFILNEESGRRLADPQDRRT
jgi:tetratricopeptide (TPR) repeat protein